MEDDPNSGLDMEERTYIALHDAMMKMYANHDGRGCFRLAAQLLTKANLPALIRARCYMMLSLKYGPLAVQYAETAVALLDVEVRKLLRPEAFPTIQLELALELLEDAKARALPASAPLEASPPEAGKTASKADELALKEAATLLPSPATEQHGLVMSGVSRTTSTQQPMVMRQHGTDPPYQVHFPPNASTHSLLTPQEARKDKTEE
ncbi:hypothetical protein P153DRAFT_430732 [Dothidotthia symphoricarpi CBS 119687]|uniref:Uncharacterized protein n=1 Tax=Dothidotthia symphoricarpi CBS 119687 TaxID=1392245 RepID=A0A6A6AI18_9PLEO|nr:uncharacterized protein P153DRAFT_430732 [Dothidotthia symphoricarpi CBS 119687]KAF2130557.1 hypothetical protein P153DRAFT_430732 [Dothidotthia symphoricarpi CBS 119687]